MEKLTKIIAELKALNAELDDDNKHDRSANEKAFESAVRDYITGTFKLYQYGGVVNCIVTVRTVLEELHEKTGITDYETAANVLNGIEEKVDLKYKEAY